MKSTGAAVWLALAAGWVRYLRASGQSPADWLEGSVDAASGAWWAIPVFVLAYLVRPLLLLPASLLTVAAGILFGPLVGIPVAIVAVSASAFVAFQFGASLKRLDARLDGFDPHVFVASLVIFVTSIAVSKVIQRQAVPA